MRSEAMKNRQTTHSSNLKPQTSNLKPQTPAYDVEAEVIPGLEEMARAEVGERLGRQIAWRPAARDDVLRFHYGGDLRSLLGLRAVVAVFVSQAFPVPRPRALLGHQHLTALLGLITTVRGLHPPGTFHTLRISAAGEESSVLTRLRDAI